MRRSDFHYDLPPDRIAQAPADRRDGSRLLVVGGTDGAGPPVADRAFSDVLSLIPGDAVVVLNDTRVFPARLHLHKPSGGAVELLLVDRLGDRRWRCMARSSKPLRAGTVLAIDTRDGGGGPTVTIAAGRDDEGLVVAELPAPADELCAAYGDVPLPPYIARPDGATEHDRERYQTVYAREPGAVAAPTAGLHFTDALVAALPEVTFVTLHVGPGTFAPVRADDLADHVMHAERFEVPPRTADLVASGRPVVAVGTTVVRALEAHSRGDRGDTRLFIAPGFEFRAVDHLITNFHLPESTLLMLVCAFAGTERVMAAYRHAVGAGYRFYSYGDAMWMSRA
jgi:S-adenosylmethionine:tRNA ribosyltransferase-isomerase